LLEALKLIGHRIVLHKLRIYPKLWLVVAAFFHVFVTLTVFGVGYFKLLPGTFDAYGTGISFAADGLAYRDLASEIVTRWQTEGISVWIETNAPLHLRFYSLSFRVVADLVGYNILAAEPFNVLFYVSMLLLVFLLGREVFNDRVGTLAAIIVGLWPTLLIHSTQLVRDPLSIDCMLALVLLLTLVLTRTLSFKQSLLVSLASVVLLTMFWLARGNMWNLIVILLLSASFLLAIRLFRERKPGWNILVVVVFAGATLLIPASVKSMTIGATKSPKTPFSVSNEAKGPGELWASVIRQVGQRRAGFRVYGPQGSNIDEDVRLTNTADIIRYLPKATLIGFMAPFPRSWFQTGKVGLAGRLISGLETLLMYLLYILVGVCVWHERRRLQIWLILFVATAGLISLGLVVMNIGALFRLRYVFWILLIVLAMRGAQILLEKKGWVLTSQSS
jgi:hypothetical protein